MVECDALEMRLGGNVYVGSNPTLSVRCKEQSEPGAKVSEMKLPDSLAFWILGWIL